MKTPLSRNPVLWIMVGINLLAADVVAVFFALSMFRHMPAVVVTARPATAPAAQAASGRPASATSSGTITKQVAPVTNADPGKTNYPWQVEQYQQGLMENSPPQVKIVPTAFPGRGWSRSDPRAGMAIGVGMQPQMIVQTAYQWRTNANRILWPADLPTDQYDFIANLPTGGFEALQEEARKVLGLAASRATVVTNVMILKVNHTDAPGLKPGTTPVRGGPPAPAQPPPPGMSTMRNTPMSILASQVENMLRIPVVDQTGLTGRYDIAFPRPMQMGGITQFDTARDQLKQGLLDQCGLDLVPGTAPVEFLVVRTVPKGD